MLKNLYIHQQNSSFKEEGGVIMKKITFIFVLLLTVSFSGFSQDVFDLQKATINVASRVGASVVSISATVEQKIQTRFHYRGPQGRIPGFDDDVFNRFFEDFFGNLPETLGERVSLGSGVIIDEHGYILTNSHVVKDADEITVTLADGRQLEAELKGVDPRSDLAVIKVESKKLPVTPLGDSDSLEIGQFVLALGNPFGISTEFNAINKEPTVTMGVVSALNRFLPSPTGGIGHDGLIQTDAAINPGNSGGPLVDLNGNIVGINVAIMTRSGGYQGVGFAIPVNKAKRILDKLIKGEKVLYGWLGVGIQDLNDDLREYFKIEEGVIVEQVFDDSPAKKAGFKEGDVILEFDGKKISNTRNLVNLVSSTKVGKKAAVVILREGKKEKLNVTIASRGDDKDIALLDGEALSQDEESFKYRGMEVTEISRRMDLKKVKGENAVAITKIEKDSLADKAGLNEGDIIIRVGAIRVKSLKQFKKIVSSTKGDCLLKTNRGYFVIKEK